MKLNKISLLAVILLAGCSSNEIARYDAHHNDASTGYATRHTNKGFNTGEAWQHAQAAHKKLNVCESVKGKANANPNSLTAEQIKVLADCEKNGNVYQVAQAAKKTVYHGFGQSFELHGKNFAYLNGSLCAIDEDNADATVYQSGLYNVIVYHHTGKVALMKQGALVGYMKK
ncbi:hypothetical protein ACJJVG_08770 [Pseudocitrobacter faecalis]|uniref:hypothetical protein n=1 Tax=Pseudocitrobacter faecalis TaxID=1398493 RepID=UPI00389ADC02